MPSAKVGVKQRSRFAVGDSLPRAHLQDTIKQLRLEIDAGAPLGAEQMDALRSALREIETLLESGDSPAQHESILARLNELSTESAHVERPS